MKARSRATSWTLVVNGQQKQTLYRSRASDDRTGGAELSDGERDHDDGVDRVAVPEPG